jgi:hypothetical protein
VLDYEALRAKGIRYHPNTLRRLWQATKFSRPFKPSAGKLCWWEREIDEWLEERAEQRDQQQEPE